MTKRVHSVFSPSSAERWLNCPGSIWLAHQYPMREESSWYAERGTEAHAMAEGMLRKWLALGRPATLDPLDLEEFRPVPVEIKLMSWETSPPVDPEGGMFEHVLTYVRSCVDAVWTFNDPKKVSVQIERRLKLNDDPAMFGTVDFFVVGERAGGVHAAVLDLKYGTSPVDAEDNMQLAYYACMVRKNSVLDVESVEVSIIQPRAKRKRKHSITVHSADELDALHELLVLGAECAQDQLLEYEAPEFSAGKWCFFCPAREVCITRKEAEANRAALREHQSKKQKTMEAYDPTNTD
jgi:hypothetical protein